MNFPSPSIICLCFVLFNFLLLLSQSFVDNVFQVFCSGLYITLEAPLIWKVHHQGSTQQRTPENCTWLKFRQRRVKACHPAHHCDSIWPSTGNITNLPTESLCRHHWIAPCHKGCAFYSPPMQSIENIPQGDPRLEGPAVVLHTHSLVQCVRMCVCVSVIVHQGSCRETNFSGNDRSSTVGYLCMGILRYNSVCKLFTLLWRAYVPLRWGSSRGLQPQSPTGREKRK